MLNSKYLRGQGLPEYIVILAIAALVILVIVLGVASVLDAKAGETVSAIEAIGD